MTNKYLQSVDKLCLIEEKINDVQVVKHEKKATIEQSLVAQKLMIFLLLQIKGCLALF